MSRKLFIIIITVVLGLFVVGLIAYYFSIQNNNGATSGGTSGFKNFFPFGGSGSTGTTTPGTNPNEPVPTPPTNFTQKLRELSLEPVAGAGTLDSKAGTSVRYIEKATGHIFEVELFSPNTNRISNTTIPVVYDAIWGSKNSALIARYLKDDDQTVDTYSLILKSTSTTTENIISGIAFPGNITDVSVLADSVFYLQQSGSASTGYTSNFSGGSRKQIWNSPIVELLSQYVNAKTVALTTKPAQNIPGFMYFVDTGTGKVRKVVGDIAGLSTLTNDLGTQVVLMSEASNASLSLYDIKSNTYKSMTPTTFPEKCVWSKKDRNIVYCAVPRESVDGSSLTSWYQGFVSFTDDIWKYDLKNNTSNVVENLFDDANGAIDVMKPILSENEQYLVFMNRTDNTLWSLDLTK